ncbi:hypothetical protein B0H14DRAFT_2565787 [Mycena olivaceomarginata]|nr:hypothetical protein B0H14DRAFT_2565787 [Mycena olivaceomarginata]
MSTASSRGPPGGCSTTLARFGVRAMSRVAKKSCRSVPAAGRRRHGGEREEGARGSSGLRIGRSAPRHAKGRRPLPRGTKIENLERRDVSTVSLTEKEREKSQTLARRDIYHWGCQCNEEGRGEGDVDSEVTEAREWLRERSARPERRGLDGCLLGRSDTFGRGELNLNWRCSLDIILCRVKWMRSGSKVEEPGEGGGIKKSSGGETVRETRSSRRRNGFGFVSAESRKKPTPRMDVVNLAVHRARLCEAESSHGNTCTRSIETYREVLQHGKGQQRRDQRSIRDLKVKDLCTTSPSQAESSHGKPTLKMYSSVRDETHPRPGSLNPNGNLTVWFLWKSVSTSIGTHIHIRIYIEQQLVPIQRHTGDTPEAFKNSYSTVVMHSLNMTFWRNATRTMCWRDEKPLTSCVLMMRTEGRTEGRRQKRERSEKTYKSRTPHTFGRSRLQRIAALCDQCNGHLLLLTAVSYVDAPRSPLTPFRGLEWRTPFCLDNGRMMFSAMEWMGT